MDNAQKFTEFARVKAQPSRKRKEICCCATSEAKAHNGKWPNWKETESDGGMRGEEQVVSDATATLVKGYLQLFHSMTAEYVCMCNCAWLVELLEKKLRREG